MLPTDESFDRFSVVNPLERTESIGHWSHTECLQVDLSVEARGVFLEDFVHYLEELLHALVETQILPTLDQEVVVLFVAAVHRDSLRSLDRAKDQ